MLPQKILKPGGSQIIYRFSWRCFCKKKKQCNESESEVASFLAGSRHLMRDLIAADG